MGQFPDPTWMAGFRDRVNGDPELAVIGRWFTTDFAVSFGDTRYVLHVREGRIADLTVNPRFDVRSRFGLRAPLEVWRRFLQPNPPPLFHDVFAMLMRVPEFVLDGDTLVAMQNARALHRMMNLMQGMGETHA
ncbi:hypothetical protein HL658_14480 [Azospirillum sp. RWY-5-1]|uniref:SCP2 domain-containing protein n=1 Tax=Azospirillum oleiclasticum TaxID=2735135 RepID=A0ABX2T9S2_9PROT|nr:hypothetical protein [Azospirillum oleiclasticum]NYZ13758.1 hypothetical protein [Azospirillum oleiclasticum]NYZ21030.1 hypothetical protein [Azospirillum oleiclasticum]